MRLWHEALIPYLDRQRLLGLHRECCALRGGGWGKKHATVDYVFTHPYGWLVEYHMRVMDEMEARGYCPNSLWWSISYRGNSLARLGNRETDRVIAERIGAGRTKTIYPEHDEAYLQECLDNLAGKGIIINREDIK